MAKKKTSDYERIDRPYDSRLRREKALSYTLGGEETLKGDGSSGQSGGEGAGGSVESKNVKTGQSLGDLWITNFIRSENWKPKTQGFTIDGNTGYAEFSNVYVSGSLTLNTTSSISGGQTDYDTGTGFFLGYSGGAYKFSVGIGGTGPSLTFDGVSVNSKGANITSPGSSTDISLLDYTHDITFSVLDTDTVQWGSGTIRFSNGQSYAISAGNTGNMSAKTYIYFNTVTPTVLSSSSSASTVVGATKLVVAIAQNGTSEATFQVYGGAGGLKVGSSQVNIANNNWTYTGTFTATDADTVTWSAGGIFKVSNGTEYTIGAGTTYNMTGKTYIYFNISSSTTFQTTQSASTAVGDGKILVAVAEVGTTLATFTVMHDQQRSISGSQLVTGTVANTKLVAGSITTNELSTGAVTAGKIAAGAVTVGTIAAGAVVANSIAAGQITGSHISGTTLSALKADLGTITAGTITLNTSGYIRSGQTGFNTGTGWWIGIDSVPKFSIGNPNAAHMTWDGSELKATDLKVLYGFTAAETITNGQPVCIIPAAGVGLKTESFYVPHTGVTYQISCQNGVGPDKWLAQPFRAGSSVSGYNRIYIDAIYANKTDPGQVGTLAVYTWDAVNKVPLVYVGFIDYLDDGDSASHDSLTENSGYRNFVLTPGVDYCIVAANTGYNSTQTSTITWYGSSTGANSSTYGTYLTETAKHGTISGGFVAGGDTGIYQTFRLFELVYGSQAGGCALSSAGIAVDARFRGHLGFAQNSASAGQSVGVAVFGIAENITGISAGTTYYLSDIDKGQLKTTAPTANYTGAKILGSAISASEILMSSS